jgi:hypothetical protein
MIESLSDRSERLRVRGRSGSKHCNDRNSMRKERATMRMFRKEEELGDNRNVATTFLTHN